MTDSYARNYSEEEINQADTDAVELQEAATADKTYLEQETQNIEQRTATAEAAEAKDAQYKAEQEDPRNKENWGIGGVVKELQSAFGGGLQDTASSIATLGERVIDTATGEMQEETKDGGKYTAEWDDFFVDDANPIETKTWWGGLIRSATHFGSMGVAIVKAAPALGVGATAIGAGRAVTAVGGLVANQWARAAAVGVATDLVSKYSQDANGLQILRDRYGFIDTPLTTNDVDHPVVKTFKNVVEGAGIGTLADGLFRVMGKAKNALPEGMIAKGAARAKSVTDQIIEKGKIEVEELGTKFGAHKNKPAADSWQAAPTSKDDIMEVKASQTKVRTDWGSQDGSPGSVTTPAQLHRNVQTSGMSGELVAEVYKSLGSSAPWQVTMKEFHAARTTL